MLSDFDSKKILEELNEINRAKEERKSIEEQLEAIKGKRENLEKEKDQFEHEKNLALVETKKSNIFSRIASIFHRGKYYMMKQRIETRENSIRNTENRIQELDEKERELIAKKNNLQGIIDSKQLPGCISEEFGRVVITEKINPDEKTQEVYGENLPFQDRVLIHSTNFFPREHKILSSYDGQKKVSANVEYYGVPKKVIVPSTRHEVHFTINNRVKDTGGLGEGDWKNPSYIIVDDYMAHEHEMEHVSASDAWTNGKSMSLSPNAVILVDINKKSELSSQDENMGSYNIIYYDGDATKCLQNFLKLNNYQIAYTDARDGAHNISLRMKQEEGTFARNVAINFMRDNSYNLRDAFELSPDEIAQVVDIAVTSVKRIPVVFSNIQLQDNVKIPNGKEKTYKEIADFIIASGLKKNNNGMYTFKSDDEIIEDIIAVEDSVDIRASKQRLPDCVDLDLIEEVFTLQQQLAKQHELADRPTFEEISQMPITEMFKFRNQLAGEVFSENLPQWTYMTGLEDSKVALNVSKREIEDMSEKIKSEDRITYAKAGYEFAIYTMEIDAKSKKVSDVSKLFEDFERRIQEIKDRKDINIDNNNQR